MIGVDENGGVEVHTIDIPYQARKEKLELDEKNIYRFGMGLNTSSLKDTSATTNIAIKAAYSLLDLKCKKHEIRLKQFMRRILQVFLDEINESEDKGYQMKDIYFRFNHEIMSNAQENAQIALIEAQTRQAEINTLLSLGANIKNEMLMQLICEQLDLSWKDLQPMLIDPNEAENDLANAQNNLNGVMTDEPKAEGTGADLSL